MRLKYYLRGMGIGITFATLLLTISFYFGKDSLVKEKLTDEEIIERATALGMSMPEDMVVTEEEEEIVAEDAGAESDDASNETAKSKEETTATEDENAKVSKDTKASNTSSSADKKETKEPVDNSSNEAKDSTVTYIPFTISPGESSEIISAHLYKAGLVDSSKEFNSYLNELNVDNRVSTGTFYIQQGSSYDDIVAQLVNKSTRLTSLPEAEAAPQAPEAPKTPVEKN